MPDRFLGLIARRPSPAFVTSSGELRLLRRLHRAGYVDASFFPAEKSAGQFAEFRGMTPVGRRMLDIVAGPGRPASP